MKHSRLLELFSIILLMTGCTSTRPHTTAASSIAPQDQPVAWTNLAAAKSAIAPYVAQARATYPQAKQRYLAGLPADQAFFVTVELKDDNGLSERVFLAVDRIEEGNIAGRIWNDVALVQGYALHQPYTVAEADIQDWLIAHRDGTEEGNFVGKYLDSKAGRSQ
jgi:uncharacterized protein YegJ (DUF2314 family)